MRALVPPEADEEKLSHCGTLLGNLCVMPALAKMNLLHRVLGVEFSRLSDSVDGKDTTALLLSWQLLRFQLTITFVNENGNFDSDGAALMAALGESDFGLMWRKLFDTLRILPVVVGAASPLLLLRSSSSTLLSLSGAKEILAERTGTISQKGHAFFFFGVPPFWRHEVQTNGNTVGEEGDFSNVINTAGKVITVFADPVATVEKEELLNVGETSEQKMKKSIPSYMRSTYTFSYTLPDLENFHGAMTLGFVLLLPLSRPYEIPNSGNNNNNNNNNNDDDDDIILRALFPVGEQKVGSYRPSSVILGTCYYRGQLAQLLHCTSLQVSFDIFSTWIGDSLGSLSNIPLSLEQRMGPRGAELKTVELLRRAVTVTPIIVHEFRVPVAVKPDESINFQFAIQVRPHLCCLLEAHSLGEVYGKYVRSYAKDAGEDESKTDTCPSSRSPSKNPRRIPGTTNPSIPLKMAGNVGTVDEISRDELQQLMSLNFTSHAYVHYELMSRTSDDSITSNYNYNNSSSTGTALLTKRRTIEGEEEKNEGDMSHSLQLRHRVHWSMSMPQ